MLDTSSCLVLEQEGGTERESHTITFQISGDETESTTLTSVISPGPKHSMFNKTETTRLQDLGSSGEHAKAGKCPFLIGNTTKSSLARTPWLPRCDPCQD
ncbi:hypothetical protein PO909_007151 [Leuciscus waleckii]